jgi:hypothetical protein
MTRDPIHGHDREASPGEMPFGRFVFAAKEDAPALWIDEECQGANGSVGSLVPDRFEGILRVLPAAPKPTGWWADYRSQFQTIASIGERYTTTPERAWFAIWEGHGFDKGSTRIASSTQLDEESSLLLAAERRMATMQDGQRNALIRVELEDLQQFHRPNRAYYLLGGPVKSATRLVFPGFNEWRNPDLFWPDDRAWFVATDVDFWSIYVAGSRLFLSALSSQMQTANEWVTMDSPLDVDL